MSAATSITLSGPTTGIFGIQTAPFTITLDGLYTGTLTPSDSGMGGSFMPPTPLHLVNSSTAQTFSYVPAEVATIPISVSANPALTVIGSPINLVVSPGAGVIITFADPRQGEVITDPSLIVFQGPQPLPSIAIISPRDGIIIS